MKMKVVFNKVFGPVIAASLVVACAANTSSNAPEEASSLAVATTPAAPKVSSGPLAAGLYQTAYSARNDVLWVTAAVGRPPVTSSALIKVDPRTRQAAATITPPVLDAATGGLEAVYGVAVDDEHDNVWVTNTRNNSVAVYRQSDGVHLTTLPNVPHAREVVVDEEHDTAWASAFGGAALVAYDTVTLQEKRRVNVTGSGPTGLVVDKHTGALYAADLNLNQIIEVPLAADLPPRFIPAAGGPISIDLSADGHTAYVAAQSGNALLVVDLVAGAVTKTVPTGAGALAVAVDPATGHVLVANRTAATVSVVDPATGAVTSTIPTNPNPNHIAFGGGTAWIVDKSAAGPDRKDTLYAVTFGR